MLYYYYYHHRNNYYFIIIYAHRQTIISFWYCARFSATSAEFHELLNLNNNTNDGAMAYALNKLIITSSRVLAPGKIGHFLTATIKFDNTKITYTIIYSSTYSLYWKEPQKHSIWKVLTLRLPVRMIPIENSFPKLAYSSFSKTAVLWYFE